MGQATKWSALTEVLARLITPVTNMILARVLTPEAFGVVATLTMVISFAEIFTDAGFQKYLIQHEFVDKDELDSCTNVAFWTNLLFSLLLWCVIGCFGPSIAAMVGSPGCGMAVSVMSAQIPLLAFSSIQMARYRREFDYKTLFVVRMATAAIPLVVTLPLAFAFRSYWALVLGILARDVLNAVILTAKSPWKPKLTYSIQKLKEMLAFSVWTIVENVSIWLTGYAGILIVGVALNDYHLGLYKTATSMVSSIMGVITTTTMPVLFTALSRYQNDDLHFRDIYFRYQRMISLLVIPLGLGMYVYRRLGVLILLGDQWEEAGDLFGMWAMAGTLTVAISYCDSEVFRSKGKPKLSVLSQSLYLLLLVPVLLWSSVRGFETIAICSSMMRVLGIGISSTILQCAIGIRFSSVLKNIWPSLVSATVMAVAGMLMRTLFDSILWELFTVLLCVLIYAGVMLLLPAGRRQLAEIPILSKLLPLGNKITDEGDEERC